MNEDFANDGCLAAYGTYLDHGYLGVVSPAGLYPIGAGVLHSVKQQRKEPRVAALRTSGAVSPPSLNFHGGLYSPIPCMRLNAALVVGRSEQSERIGFKANPKSDVHHIRPVGFYDAPFCEREHCKLNHPDFSALGLFGG